MDRIPLEECKNGGLYRISSRNLTFGVYREEAKGFVGIREKFGYKYLFTEYHWDTGAPFGTVHPKQFLENCPLVCLREHLEDKTDNKELFKWLEEKEEQYKDLLKE